MAILYRRNYAVRAVGQVASQVAIKTLGTKGGGFFNATSGAMRGIFFRDCHSGKVVEFL